jgi:hypothetical protein
MKMTVNDKGDRLDVSLFFPDSRLVDLEIALRLAGRPHQWQFTQADKSLDHVEYQVNSSSSFLAAVHFTHGLEPPTRALFENKSPETGQYLKGRRGSVIFVTKEFLSECADRGLVSHMQKDKALLELNRHDKVEV